MLRNTHRQFNFSTLNHQLAMTSNSINWDNIKKVISGFGVEIYSFEECSPGKFIGSGAAMEVYEGECKIDMTPKHVAFKYHKKLKRSKLRQSEVDGILNEFQHEIKLMRKVRHHPNVVQIYGVTFDVHEPILIVELGNETLDNYLQEKFELGNPASWVEKMKLCLDVLRGIRGLHDVGIIHGDIKGGNILVFTSSTDVVTAKISDFGYSSTLTSSKRNVGGTMCFMAPEAIGIYPELTPWQKKPVNDIFSFGLLTYQTATDGKMPYEDSDSIILARNTDRDMKILLSKLHDDTPEQFRTVIINTTKFMPTDRASIDVLEMIIMDFLSNHSNITVTTIVPPPVTVEDIWKNPGGINWEILEKYIVGLGADIYPYEECVLEDFIGEGSVMEVYKGQCTINNSSKRVALKRHKYFKKTGWKRSHVKYILKCFRHEITLMRKTKNHSNIIQLYGVAFHERKPILIVELAQETIEVYLENKFESGSPASWVEKTKLCLDVLRGIEGLHNAGIIHGDINGSNVLIFIEPTGAATAKISDFVYSSTLSSSGNIGGTFIFIAPEALGIFPELIPWSKKQTRDIYNFGLVTYQIATNGKTPYEEYEYDDVISTMAADHDSKILLSDLPDDTPEEFRTIIVNTTRFKPADRLSIDTAKQIFISFLDNRS